MYQPPNYLKRFVNVKQLINTVYGASAYSGSSTYFTSSSNLNALFTLVWAKGIQYYASYKPNLAFYTHSSALMLFYRFGNNKPNTIAMISESNSCNLNTNASSSVYLIGNLNFFHLNTFP